MVLSPGILKSRSILGADVGSCTSSTSASAEKLDLLRGMPTVCSRFPLNELELFALRPADLEVDVEADEPSFERFLYGLKRARNFSMAATEQALSIRSQRDQGCDGDKEVQRSKKTCGRIDDQDDEYGFG